MKTLFACLKWLIIVADTILCQFPMSMLQIFFHILLDMQKTASINILLKITKILMELGAIVCTQAHRTLAVGLYTINIYFLLIFSFSCNYDILQANSKETSLQYYFPVAVDFIHGLTPTHMLVFQ